MFLGISISVPLHLPPLFLCSLPDAPPPLWPAMCSAHAASAPHCTEPRALPALPAAFPASRWPPLLLPTLRRRRPSSHAPRRCCQFQLAHVVPLWALRHTQQLLPDLLNARKDSFSTATLLPELSLSPDPAAIPSHRRQPPPVLPIPDPKHKQHYRDPPKLPEQINSKFFHWDSRTTAPTSSSSAARSASPSTHPYRAS
jgi:hypothetical protein